MSILMTREMQKLIAEGKSHHDFLSLAIANDCLDTPHESAKNSLVVEGDASWHVVNNVTDKPVNRGTFAKA